jgi:hypothetical protein
VCQCAIDRAAIGLPRDSTRGPWTIADEAGSDRLIVVGHVVGYSFPDDPTWSGSVDYLMEVEEPFLFPGEHSTSTVVVRSFIGWYACGISLDVGERALVYASAIDEVEGVFFTSTCHRTVSLARADAEWERSERARLRALSER